MRQPSLHFFTDEVRVPHALFGEVCMGAGVGGSRICAQSQLLRRQREWLIPKSAPAKSCQMGDFRVFSRPEIDSENDETKQPESPREYVCALPVADLWLKTGRYAGCCPAAGRSGDSPAGKALSATKGEYPGRRQEKAIGGEQERQSNAGGITEEIRSEVQEVKVQHRNFLRKPAPKSLTLCRQMGNIIARRGYGERLLERRSDGV